MDNDILKRLAKLETLLEGWSRAIPELKDYQDRQHSPLATRIDDAIHVVTKAAEKTERAALAQSDAALTNFRQHVLAYCREQS